MYDELFKPGTGLVWWRCPSIERAQAIHTNCFYWYFNRVFGVISYEDVSEGGKINYDCD
jgi:hypothetical protein